ncbi:CCN family member 1-like [Lampris incognitus]|uniref:CCN family member 1-like n=1 Tax=Lampris incognitus TaxID=2546036 RepID=UPI0024B5EFCC|nr:CCN family member 1-like [Lampris incognitus]
MGFLIYLVYLPFLTIVHIAEVTCGCPAVCTCPDEPLMCPPGVNAVPDGCGCCKVCAAQLNQDCSPMMPCDHHKGLECNYGNDVTIGQGICRAKLQGRTCEYNSRIYQNGESFRVGCKHQCTCIDGAVGCGPLCENQLPPASPSCPYPRLVRVPGQCCFTVDCHKGIWRLPTKHQPSQHQPHRYPVLYQPGNGLVSSNEILSSRPSGWEDERDYSHVPVWNHLTEQCVVQTTEWSQCSRSCGMGVSSRITNNNPQCKMERETRICTLRPCHGLPGPAKKGKRCSPTHKTRELVRLSHGECLSTRLYRPNYCGVCTDGRCCSPRRTRTVPVTFVCPDGERFQRMAMFIQSCKCSNECSHLNEVALPPQH